MSFAEAVRTNFSKYVTFSGRARRSEFWWWVLFCFLAGIVLGWVDFALFGETATYVGEGAGGIVLWSRFTPFTSIFGLATLLPSLSVTVRRLHDFDKSGWWWWLWVIPLVGAIVLIVWLSSKGTVGPNRYGRDPLGGAGPGGTSVPHVSR
ncbi:DUF805 domain-containing protein [Pseudoroseicyclus tamaricis]|uniref:DUF805 domain-containing protein n=1 Tax=Pseudoroseicyclus tamaricis TaxID=2705421 RepID=A0A6B2JU48_9RHOB|nr:DUF805 domain-containing protein [Pseudoroseicyclus tamaricis]NDV02067.1 DUF805 domain-containing protein [Pseudoroseicyclus tamaricis]